MIKIYNMRFAVLNSCLFSKLNKYIKLCNNFQNCFAIKKTFENNKF